MKRSGADRGIDLRSHGSRTRTARGALVAVGLSWLAALLVLLVASSALARSAFDSPYSFERTYNAALRLVRIDLGLKVTEKDDQSGYLVFDYKSADTGNKVSSGSMEFIRPREADGPVHVVVQLPQMPRYHEQVLVDALVRKMHQDYGQPLELPKPPPPAPSPSDAGADGDTEAP
jgi:hypothetical protein